MLKDYMEDELGVQRYLNRNIQELCRRGHRYQPFASIKQKQ
jgi:hypothetical protein